MGDHTRVSWPLDFDPRIAAPSDEARSAAVGRGGDRRVRSLCEKLRRRMWAERSTRKHRCDLTPREPCLLRR